MAESVIRHIIEGDIETIRDSASAYKAGLAYGRQAGRSEVLALVMRLKCGSCWCEVGIGNPMMQGRHSDACLEVQRLVDNG